MKCSNCGQEVEAGSKFCMYCGSPVTENAPADSQSQPQPQQQDPSRQPQQDPRYQNPQNPNRQQQYRDPRYQNPQDPNRQRQYRDPRYQNPQDPSHQRQYRDPRYQNPQDPSRQRQYRDPRYQNPQDPSRQRQYRDFGDTGVMSFSQLIRTYTGFDLQEEWYRFRTVTSVRWKYIGIFAAIAVLLFGLLPSFSYYYNYGHWTNFYYRLRYTSDLWWFTPMLRYFVMWTVVFFWIDQYLWAIPGLAGMIIELGTLIAVSEGSAILGVWLMLFSSIAALVAMILARVFKNRPY